MLLSIETVMISSRPMIAVLMWFEMVIRDISMTDDRD